MHCEPCRDALSARLDGEDPGLDVREVDAHLASCADCRSYQLRLVDLHRTTRVRQAEGVPDLSAAILARVVPASNPHDRVLGWLRSGIVFIGVLLVGSSAALLLANSTENPAHLAAWDLAFGGALLVAAAQPDRARGLLPMAVLLAASMTIASVIEINDGHDPTHGLLFHVCELLGVILLTLLARHRRPTHRRIAGIPVA